MRARGCPDLGGSYGTRVCLCLTGDAVPAQLLLRVGVPLQAVCLQPWQGPHEWEAAHVLL